MRTLTRLFAEQTRMGFAQWRVHARISAAIGLLTEGATVSTVARQVGYASSSTFVRVFRDATGETPGACGAGRSTTALELDRWVD